MHRWELDERYVLYVESLKACSAEVSLQYSLLCMISYQESSRIEPHHFTATSLSAVVIWPKNTPHYRSRRWSSRVLRHLILLHRDGSRPTAVPLHLFVAQQRRWGTLAPPHGAVESSPCNSSSLLAATERVLDAQSSVVLNQAWV